ncbi:hypothetical protein DOTSEDRAFT_69158 [Dothistroma septosporum NZE10]|uniref:Uncharacterized protein n=1 Tax=Dothistroma septosporum (strain NZE10 / CBS 128990) TaxID=675120 RepID=N1PY21_DOTSN|nr:hypothetical protein DOTSEDRAFT_69158 [Dothistroma septosporum NZE10]
MAAVLLIWGAVTIRERVEKKAEEKRMKKERDAMRYAELQKETERRLSLRRSESGNYTVVGAAGLDEEKEEEEDGDRWWEEPEMQVPAHEPVAARGESIEAKKAREDTIPEKKASRGRRGIKSFLRPTPA